MYEQLKTMCRDAGRVGLIVLIVAFSFGPYYFRHRLSAWKKKLVWQRQ